MKSYEETVYQEINGLALFYVNCHLVLDILNSIFFLFFIVLLLLIILFIVILYSGIKIII